MCRLFIIKRLLKLFKIHILIINNRVPIINNRGTDVRLFIIKSLNIYTIKDMKSFNGVGGGGGGQWSGRAAAAAAAERWRQRQHGIGVGTVAEAEAAAAQSPLPQRYRFRY
jgi:hypothetical protein